MKKSPQTLIFGVLFNLGTTMIYYFWLSTKHEGDILEDKLDCIMYFASLALLIICIPLFVLTAIMEPGFI
jgi:hypothetical protein